MKFIKNTPYKIILSVIITIFSSCVYYNTFYHAKSSYNEARKSQIKRSNTSIGDTLALVNDIEKSKFERAIQKASKVLDVYPQKKKWADDAIMLIGYSYFYMGEYSKAIRKFKELLAIYPNSPFAADALLFLGKAYSKNGDLDLADETFDKFKKVYPQNKEIASIPVFIAETTIKKGSKLTALAQLNDCLDSIDSKQAYRIHLMIARLYFEIGKYKECFDEYNKINNKDLLLNEEFEKNIRQSECLIKMDSLKNALNILFNISNDNRFSDRVAEILNKEAECYEAMKDYKKALSIYLNAAGAKDEPDQVAIANFRIGNLYQKFYGDFIKAAEYYSKAASGANPEIQKIATKRSESIDKINNYTKLLDSSAPDSLKNADTLLTPSLLKYKMGEIYWFELEETDSAIVFFNKTTYDTTCLDTLKAHTYYALAWLFRYDKSDTVKSDSLLHEIIDKYPNTDLAKSAQKSLGQPITIKTRKDSSQMAFLDAEAVLWENDKKDSAAMLFDSVAQKYSNTPIGPKAAYASAWIFDQLLSDSTQAAKRYETINKTWKDTEYGNISKQKMMSAILSDSNKEIKKGEKSDSTKTIQKTQ